MRFRAYIRQVDGELRSADFDSPYDATAVLVARVESEVLAPGESIWMTDPPRDGHDRDRKVKVPHIVRIA